MEAAVMVDSNATLGIINGNLRHVRIGHFWVQEMAETVELDYQKVDTKKNVADLFTKNLPKQDVVKFTEIAQSCED